MWSTRSHATRKSTWNNNRAMEKVKKLRPNNNISRLIDRSKKEGEEHKYRNGATNGKRNSLSFFSKI